MKGKIDVTEVRVEELTAELLKKTEEVQLLKVIYIYTSPHREKICLYHHLIPVPRNTCSSFTLPFLMLYFFIQTEAEAAFAESDELKRACEAAEKAHEDLKQKTKVTEVFTRFLFSFCTHYFLSTLSHCLVTFIKKKKY